MESMTVDGNDDLSVLIDHKTGQALGWGLNLTSEECTAVVGKRPTKLEIFSHKSLW